MNNKSLTLHIRITKQCNADCSYCSSFNNNIADKLSISELDTVLDNMIKLIKKKQLGGSRELISVQYVGGEISVLDTQYIRDFTSLVREKLSPLFTHFQHGVQSNLICSERKLREMIDIFGQNIGSSVDNFTKQRTIKGSSDKYQTIFLKNQTKTRRITGKTVPCVIVIDDKMSPYIFDEIAIAEKNNMDITLRPVFQGGSTISRFNKEDIKKVYELVFSNWFLKSKIAIEPFYSLSMKRVNSHLGQYSTNEKACPFQRDCTKSSLNLEYNGDIYLCVEMADGQRFKLGNLITNQINHNNYDLLRDRESIIDPTCLQCKFYTECQGGCMNEAWEQKGNLYSKSPYCDIWYSLFTLIDDMVDKHTAHTCHTWLMNI